MNNEHLTHNSSETIRQGYVGLSLEQRVAELERLVAMLICDSATKPLGFCKPFSWLLAAEGCTILSVGHDEFQRDFEVI